VANTVGSSFATPTPAGTKQGDPVSPTAFITYLDLIMETVHLIEESGISKACIPLLMTLTYWRQVEFREIKTD